MIYITSDNIQYHVNIIISTEYVQYTQVSVKIFGLGKMKGTDNNMLSILSLYNFFHGSITIDCELSWSFQGKLLSHALEIGVGHADNNAFCNF